MRKTWDLIKPTFVLVIICFVISGLLALTYNLGGIAALSTAGYSKEELLEFSSYALPGADELEPVKVSVEDENFHSVYKAKNGAGMALVVYAKGYSSDGMTVMYGFDGGGVMQGVYVISQTETPGIGDNVAKDRDYLSKFSGQPADSFTVDTVAGATKTSGGIIEGARHAFTLFGELKGEVLGE